MNSEELKLRTKTIFWLEFTMEEEVLAASLLIPLHTEAGELTRIFAASRKTAKAMQSQSAQRMS